MSAKISKLTERLIRTSPFEEFTFQQNDALARRLRGFGPIGILSFLLIVLTGNIIFDNMIVLPIGAILALVWRWRSGTPWSEIGYKRPRNWWLTVISGLAIGCAFKFAMKIIVMPVLGADPVNQAYHFLAGNRSVLPMALLAMVVVGFAEETVFRGFLFQRGRKLFGSSPRAEVAIVMITSVWFGLAHYATQGLAGAEQGAIVGLLLGTIFAVTGQIWLPIFAHAAFDLTALLIIYWNVESYFAHLLFK